MPKHTLREKFRYHFENTMSGGPVAVIKWLAVVSIVSVVVLGAIMASLRITASREPDAEPLGFIEGVWKSLMATLDPGTMGGDEGWDFRLIRFIATLIGIFLISHDIHDVLDKAIELALEGHPGMIKMLVELHMSKQTNDEVKGGEKVAIQINSHPAAETPEIINVDTEESHNE